MKIITKDNFNRDLFIEQVVADNVNELIGRQLVEQWNYKYFHEKSEIYLELVDDEYELYNGYDIILNYNKN